MKVGKVKSRIQAAGAWWSLPSLFAAVLCLIGGMVICCFALFNHATAIVEDVTQKQSLTFLNSIRKEVSDTVVGAERSCKQLYFDQNIRYYLDKEEISKEDEQVGVIQELLRSEIVRGSRINSIYVYYERQNQIITKDDVVLADAFINDAWLGYGDMKNGMRTVTPVWTLSEYEDGKKIQTDVISIIRCFPVYTTDNLGAVVVNVEIDGEAIAYQDKMEQTITLMLNSVGIVQKSGNGGYDRGSIANILGSDIELAQIHGQEVVFRDEPVKLYASDETYFGWRILQIYPVKNMKFRYRILRQFLYAALFLGIAGAAVLLFFYRKIRKANLVNGRPVQYVTDILDRENQMLVYGLFYALLHTEGHLDERKVKEYEKMGFPMTNYYVLWVKLKRSRKDQEAGLEYDCEAVAVRVNEEISRICFGYCICQDFREFTAVVHMTDAADIKKLSEHFLKLFRELCKCGVGISVGSCAKSFEELRTSFENAKKMEKHLWLKASDRIVYYEEEMAKEKIPYYFNAESLEQLLESIRNGNEQAALLNLKNCVEDMKSGNHFSPENVYHGMLQITCTLQHLAQHIYHPQKWPQKEMGDFLMAPVEGFLEKESCQAVQKWLGGIVKEICDYRWETRGSAVFDVAISDVKEYIATHYNKEISLSLAADEFHVSESYFSRIFKQKTGENFLSYLNKYRINMAKKIMQQDRTISISDVSNRVGFENVQTFIRVFKKVENGITPGAYKELYCGLPEITVTK